ncbi:MAG: hypothetical protein EOO04_12950 [Chitinophagaceae bacterium]|nr:MAG: hypothetical protein EOO04_12950 [Chitinophagaceae bacterium]
MKQRAFEKFGKRDMAAASISVGSRLGRKVLHSGDARAVMAAIRNAIKNGEAEKVVLTDQKLKAELAERV